MANLMNFSCCFKPSSPQSPSTTSTLLPQRSTCRDKNPIVIGLRSRCTSIAAACIVFGLVDAVESRGVVAMDRPVAERPAEQEIAQWSDKIRKCPPWRLNSLENVMPENLPRPSDRRRTDGFVSAPVAGGEIRFSKSCFSL